MSSTLIIGAGGHAKVVADALQSCGIPVSGFLDDNPQCWGQDVLGLPVLGSVDSYIEYSPVYLIVAIGLNHVRQAIVQRLGSPVEQLWGNAIHSHTTIAPSAVLGKGVVVAPQSVICPDTVIGNHSIINTGATIDHDCTVGQYAHIAPGCRVAGGVKIEDGAFIGIGTSIIPGVTIGQWSTVGAGSVVLRDVPPFATAYGVPARTVRE